MNEAMMADKIMNDMLFFSLFILIGAVLGGLWGLWGLVVGANNIRELYEHDTRKGTIVCETAQSILHEGRVFCLTSEETNDSQVESIY